MLPTLIRHRGIRSRRTLGLDTLSVYASSSAIRSIPSRTASISSMRKTLATGTAAQNVITGG